MKNLEKIAALTGFLSPGVPSLDSIMSHLVLNTLEGYDARAIFLNSVRTNGMVWAPTAYGFDKEGFETLPDQSFSIDTPVHRALRTSKIVECGNSDTYLFVGLYGKSAFPEGFEYSLAWPTPGIGVLVAFFNREIDLTPFNQIFFLTIGEILSIKLNSPQYHHALGVQQPPRDSVVSVALTGRQWEVVQLIRRGLTNAEIAMEMNFSESLIRQETVQIYSKLGTAGRKELIQRDEPERKTLDTSDDFAHKMKR